MKDYAIITDSGCDLSKDMVEELGVDVVPMKLMIDGVDYRHYHDFRELSMETFFSKLREGHIGQTSCVSTGDIMESLSLMLFKAAFRSGRRRKRPCWKNSTSRRSIGLRSKQR